MSKQKLDRTMVIPECKGLLKQIEVEAHEGRWNLAFDNLTELVETTAKIRLLIDHIDGKIVPFIQEELLESDDEFI